MGSNQTLGIINNNPLNIRFSTKNNWKGQKGSNKGFCVFDTMENGIRAGFINLRTYQLRGINTINQIISTWAPSSENNTSVYIDYVEKETNINRNTQLSFNFSVYSQIVKAMCKIESKYTPIDSQMLKAFESI